MSRFRYLPAADADLDEITDYYAAHNPTAGLALLDEIDARCRLLARFPGMGRPRPELGAGIRSAAVRRYIIFFRRSSDGIDVLRVLHGARDIGPDDFVT